MERLNRSTVLWAAAAAVVLWAIGFGLMFTGVEIVDLGFIVLGSIAGAISWISALLIAARQQQWGWVVVIALTNFLGGLIYATVSADETPNRERHGRDLDRHRQSHRPESRA